MRKIRSSLSALQDAVVLIDHNNCLEWWNQAAAQILNLTAPDQGRHILTILRSPLFHEYYEDIDKFIDGIRLTALSTITAFISVKSPRLGKKSSWLSMMSRVCIILSRCVKTSLPTSRMVTHPTDCDYGLCRNIKRTARLEPALAAHSIKWCSKVSAWTTLSMTCYCYRV